MTLSSTRTQPIIHTHLLLGTLYLLSACDVLSVHEEASSTSAISVHNQSLSHQELVEECEIQYEMNLEECFEEEDEDEDFCYTYADESLTQCLNQNHESDCDEDESIDVNPISYHIDLPPLVDVEIDDWDFHDPSEWMEIDGKLMLAITGKEQTETYTCGLELWR